MTRHWFGELCVEDYALDGRLDLELEFSGELELHEQRDLAAFLLRNLIVHRDALGGCPLSGIPEINPCPLCDPAVRP